MKRIQTETGQRSAEYRELNFRDVCFSLRRNKGILAGRFDSARAVEIPRIYPEADSNG